MLAIWSLVPLPFLKPAWTSGSSWFMYCWSLAWRILSITLLACEFSAIEHSFNVVWTFFGITFLWDFFLLTPNLMVKCSVVTAVWEVGISGDFLLYSFLTLDEFWGLSFISLLYHKILKTPAEFLLAQHIPSERNKLVRATYFLGSLISPTNDLHFLTIFKKNFLIFFAVFFSCFLQENEPK